MVGVMDKKFLELLRCPISGDRLRLVDNELLDEAIAAQQTGELSDRQGRGVDEFSGGLIDFERKWFYPMRSSIPNLIPDQAIDIEQIANVNASRSRTESK